MNNEKRYVVAALKNGEKITIRYFSDLCDLAENDQFLQFPESEDEHGNLYDLEWY